MELFKLFGTIFVDNEKANKSISKTGQEADGLGTKFLKGVETVGKWGLAVGAAATSAGAAIYGVANKAAATTDNIDKMSQKIGISRKAYQELDFICSQSGTSVDKLQTGLKTLTTAMDGAKKGTDANVKLFKKLKVSVIDSKGAFRSQEDVLWDTLSSLQKVENQTEKSRLATQLFGKTGLELMPLLNGAAGSIDEMKKQAHDLGLVLNDESIDAGVKLTDTMDQAKRSFDAIISKIGVGFMPLVQNCLSFIIDNMPTIQNVMNVIFGVFNTVIVGIGSLFNYLKPIVKDLFDKLRTWWDSNGQTVMDAFIEVSNYLYGVISDVFPSIQSFIGTCFEFISMLWNNVLKPVFNVLIIDILPQLWNVFKSVFGFISEIVKLTFSTIQLLWITILKPVFDVISYILQNIVLPIFKDVFGKISKVVSDRFNEMKTIVNVVTNIFNKVKDAITKPIEIAKKTIGDIVDAIKGFFNFKIKWPSIPLPHFGIKPKGWGIGDLLKGEIPKLDIEWYAKAMDKGMILEEPTIFGASHGKLLGAGEAGSETVVGTQSLMEMINNASNQSNIDLLKVLLQIRDYLSDEERWYRIMLKALTDGSFAIVLDGREVGRIVKKYA